MRKMGGGKTSSSSSNENLASVAERDLLEFYRRHFDELQRKDDKYKEKVDRHLRELIADRHELEAEVLRRGEKISDLQKALVDLQLSCFEERERFLNVTAENERLKKNEEKLHESIRHLLSLTRDQELRDKIIYILQEPKVEIGVRYDSKTPGSSSSNVRKSKEDLFKEQLQKLQSQLDEHSKVSQIKSDVILEDCKLALMKSKEKLMKNEEEIAFLRKKLQDTENELSKFKQAQSRFRESYHSNEPTFSKQSANTSKYFATSDNSRNCASPENHYPNETTSSKQSANASKYSVISDNVGNYVAPETHYTNKTTSSKQSTNVSKYFVSSDTIKNFDSPENHHTNEATSSKQSASTSKHFVTSDNIRNSDRTDKPFDNIRSISTDLHLTLILLSKIINKILSLLSTIQSSQVYVEAAKLPKSKASSQVYIGESEVIQLQNYVRQCTRLSFDVSNLLKSLTKAVTSEEVRVRGLDVERELKELASAFEELAVATAEADLVCISLSRATFFDCLTGPKKTFEKFGVKEKSNLSKYISEVGKMEANLKSANSYVSQSLKFAERINQKCSTLSSETRDQIIQVDSDLHKNLHSSRDNLHSSEKFSKTEEPTKFDMNKFSKDIREMEKKIRTAETDDLTRKINKTLTKIKQLENSEYTKDEFCKHLAEQVNSLAEKLKEMYSEFNVKNIRDQFSEYSSLTLSKLEALAKQSRSAVMAAEAQLTAHRDNARVLSQKLRETEELLRESINECLVLKQKLQVEQLNREMDKAKFSRELHEKLHRISDFHDLEAAVKEVASSLATKRESNASGPYVCIHCREGLEHMLCSEKIKDLKSTNRRLASELKQEMDKTKFNRELHERLQHIPDYYDRETSVKRVASSVDTKKESKACGPYECMYCNQGLEHLPCTAKIKDLRSTTRRLATELKLLEHENKEEKRLARMSQEQATKALRELSLENKSLKDTVKTLETKNASLLEQLKLERNRLKNMERFRRLEMSGFQTDINNLKAKIQDLEKQLTKAVLIFEHDKKDLELLKTVHSTAQHSKQATAAIRRLKAKLYELENDIKNL
ncbi:putative leucine-rich repeat-containing protein DDB_G0290503 [Argiope bruennichi]|uniref:putative leucine-rich repeat-containing protein DDB_G0290503 n=1 Tax=Argiope bruennichi TaxID=94029 RepID=UPI0024957624|nr:putative leucine-rich repeat-containing protein DDB_G0290503 [Argiope bruennichi]